MTLSSFGPWTVGFPERQLTSLILGQPIWKIGKTSSRKYRAPIHMLWEVQISLNYKAQSCPEPDLSGPREEAGPRSQAGSCGAASQ